MDLDGALAAHADWKIKLRAAIDNHENIDVAKLSKDNCCAFGMWLHGEAKQKLRSSRRILSASTRTLGSIARPARWVS